MTEIGEKVLILLLSASVFDFTDGNIIIVLYLAYTFVSFLFYCIKDKTYIHSICSLESTCHLVNEVYEFHDSLCLRNKHLFSMCSKFSENIRLIAYSCFIYI